MTEEKLQYMLSPDEAQTIDRIRKMKEEEQRKVKKQIEILHVSYEAYKWSEEHGAGLTYSTFCDDFGYETAEYSRKGIYDAVLSTLRHVSELIH